MTSPIRGPWMSTFCNIATVLISSTQAAKACGSWDKMYHVVGCACGETVIKIVLWAGFTDGSNGFEFAGCVFYPAMVSWCL